MSEKKFIDLEVLNALVKELNKQVSIIEKINSTEHHSDHIVELSKAIGIVGSISSESMALMADIARAARPKNKDSLGEIISLDDLLKKDLS
jgi:methyl-accepting chemotaxis protein